MSGKGKQCMVKVHFCPWVHGPVARKTVWHIACDKIVSRLANLSQVTCVSSAFIVQRVVPGADDRG